MADQFVRVRLLKIAGADLNLFEFDFDLTWAAFFLSPDEQVYGRYGARDARGAEDRLSLAGLKYAIQRALEAHRASTDKPSARVEKPLRVEDYSAAKREKGCIHCHQVWEFRRDQLKSTGKWDRNDVWAYPLPENIGITLDVDRGDRVKSVTANSPAHRVGIATGDLIRKLNGYPVASIADAMYALHKAPAKGQVSVTWERSGKPAAAELELTEGWRKTNLTWRPSMLDILPSLSLSGDDLSDAEKKALGLDSKRLAFRQDKKVHRHMKEAGIEAGDVIIGVDGQKLEMTMAEFLGHVRKNYLIGERLTLNVIRGGKQLDLSLTLK